MPQQHEDVISSCRRASPPPVGPGPRRPVTAGGARATGPTVQINLDRSSWAYRRQASLSNSLDHRRPSHAPACNGTGKTCKLITGAVRHRPKSTTRRRGALSSAQRSRTFAACCKAGSTIDGGKAYWSADTGSGSQQPAPTSRRVLILFEATEPAAARQVDPLITITDGARTSQVHGRFTRSQWACSSAPSRRPSIRTTADLQCRIAPKQIHQLIAKTPTIRLCLSPQLWPPRARQRPDFTGNFPGMLFRWPRRNAAEPSSSALDVLFVRRSRQNVHQRMRAVARTSARSRSARRGHLYGPLHGASERCCSKEISTSTILPSSRRSRPVKAG